MTNRRDFFKRSALVSLAPTVPGFLARASLAAKPEQEARILVVIQLDGGNDGINTVVPFGDEAYAKFRRDLRLPTDKLFKIGDGIGLHPSMRDASELLQSGRLAIVQGVGYPNPNRSHFESMAIWQTAQPEAHSSEALGWLGRALDAQSFPGNGPAAAHVGDENLPRSLFARRAISTSFADASDLTLALPNPPVETSNGNDLAAFVARSVAGAYATATELRAATTNGTDASARYPDTQLAKRLNLVARSIKAGLPARIYSVIQSGYDSHAGQLPTHARLLGELSKALRAFLDDLAAPKLADRVIVMAFSEFGRRPEENGSLGTDHGTAGPILLAGPRVKAGLVGKTPSLGDLQAGDLRVSTDFRSIYATVLEHWLDIPSGAVLGGQFAPLPLLVV